MQIQERYRPQLMGADASYTIEGVGIGGFIAKTSGAITVNSRNQNDTNTTIVVDAIPVTAGVYLPLPLSLLTKSTVALSGGASGTLLVF